MMKGGTDGEILSAIDDYTHRNTAQTFEATYAPSGRPVGGGSVPSDATGIEVTAVVDFPTFLAFLVGTNTIEAHGDATGGFGPLDIVMVLDRSGSMDDDSCDLREAQCASSDPHDTASCTLCRGNWAACNLRHQPASTLAGTFLSQPKHPNRLSKLPRCVAQSTHAHHRGSGGRQLPS